LFRLDLDNDFASEEIYNVRVGKINDMLLMNKMPGIITVCDNSSVNVYDYSTKTEYVSRKFNASATCITAAS